MSLTWHLFLTALSSGSERVRMGTRISGDHPMPIHDWTRVGPNLFHAFHQCWIGALCDALNTGSLPEEYYALPEPVIRGPVPDVLVFPQSFRRSTPADTNGGLAVQTSPPRTRFVR